MSESTRRAVAKGLALYTAFVQLIFPALCGYVVYDFNQGTAQEHRLTVIEASRYTQADARVDRETIRGELAAIRETQAAFRTDVKYMREALQTLVARDLERQPR